MAGRVVAILCGVLLGAAVLVTGCASDRGVQEQKDEAALRETIEQYIENLNSGDVERWLSSWTDDAIIMGPNAPAVSGKEKLREAVGPLFASFEIESSIPVEEARAAGDWGYVRITYVLEMTPKAGGDPVREEGKGLIILHRQPDGSWLLARECYNTDAPAE